ncbi:hypothetical protein [Hymenobacter sp. B81]|uniref:hypothetical protein n=1 Tax=Hymenobacter sp. B81 TaxID=3344878 RepID=UPI0037DD632B
MNNQLFVTGVELDLDEQALLLPTFQVSDLCEPDKIQSDYTHEASLPSTARNHQVLGHAAYDSETARVPYRSLPGVMLKADGVEIMPRARLYLKGYSGGRYQVQLVAGNKRLVEALGEKTLRELDFSRFDHLWTLDNVAQRATAAHWAAHGWGYELFDRGKPVTPAATPFTDLYPTLSARLLWEQLLADAGFTAEPWQSALLDRLAVPAAEQGTFAEDFREARALRVGLGPGHEDGSGQPSANRNTVTRQIPFDDFTRDIGNMPPVVPSVPGVYDPATFSYTADRTVYVTAEARCAVELTVSYAKASAQVYLLVNDQEVVGGEKVIVGRDAAPFSARAAVQGLLLQAGDVLTAKVVLRGEDPLVFTGTRWGWRLFRDAAFSNGFGSSATTVPVDRFTVTVDEALPPGAEVRLQDWLPDIKLLDLFKTVVQLGGLTVATDLYDDHLRLYPSRAPLDNVARARDWTGKRDQPDAPLGMPREVSYRVGNFGQRNFFRYAEDDTVTEGYGDGVLLIDDATLPREYEMVKLPFAASEPSPSAAGLLRIARWRVRETDDPFAEPAYENVTAKPRLVLRHGTTLAVGLRGGPDPGDNPQADPDSAEQQKWVAALARFNTRRDVAMPTSYFDLESEAVSLDAGRYVLPEAWAGLRAMLADTRALKERYRLSPLDIATFDPSFPIWDASLGAYFAVRRILEYTPTRSVEVELLRLHPSFLLAPTGQPELGREFDETEHFISEFY